LANGACPLAGQTVRRKCRLGVGGLEQTIGVFDRFGDAVEKRRPRVRRKPPVFVCRRRSGGERTIDVPARRLLEFGERTITAAANKRSPSASTSMDLACASGCWARIIPMSPKAS
jgi:hypothetical protein